MIAFIFGVFLNGFGCWATWNDVDDADWSTLFFISGTFALINSLASLILMRESPRYLMSKQDFESGFTELNLMGFINRGNNYVPITNEEEKELKL